MAVPGADGGGLFAERWDRSGWSLESMPDPASASVYSSAYITSVSCSSGSFCTAVGVFYNSVLSGRDEPFAERWDGRSWSLQPMPQVPSGAGETELDGVSCTSPSACVAVGQYGFGTLPSQPTQTLAVAERWNGIGWSVQTTPNAPGSDRLNGISCTSSRACTAVGTESLSTSPSGFQPLVERWNGNTWSLEQTPGGRGALLRAVSCSSSVACTAVGSTTGADGVAEKSALATAKLTGASVRCASAPFTMRVTGDAISSVIWSLDGRKLNGRTLRDGTRYAASTRISAGSHKLTIKVTFEASSDTPARTFHRTVHGCLARR